MCVYCLLIEQAAQITNLQNTVKELQTKLKESPAVSSQASHRMDTSTVISVIDKSNTSSIPNTKSVSPSKLNEDRKFNIVISGIPQCDSGSPRLTWLAQDSSNVTSILYKIDPTLSESTVRDCYRLGKYKQNHSRPRLTLVKLSRTIDVINVLSKKDAYPSGIIIKPDLPPEERAIESELLKQRWSLVQSGTDRKAIKIKKPSLYVHNKLYGTVKNSRFYKTDDHSNQTVTTEQPSNSSQHTDLTDTSSA